MAQGPAIVIQNPPMRHLAYVGALSVLGVCLTGCGGGGDAAEPDAKTVTDPCDEAANHSDLAWIQEKVLSPSCAAFDDCHRGAASNAGGLNLEAGMAQMNLVDQPSDLFPDWKLVVPGDPASSYLMVILSGEGGPIDPEIGTMPYNSGLLCEEKIDAISRWITAL